MTSAPLLLPLTHVSAMLASHADIEVHYIIPGVIRTLKDSDVVKVVLAVSDATDKVVITTNMCVF